MAVIMFATAKGFSESPTTAPAPEAPFIQVPGPAGMKAWSDGKSLLCVKDGKLVATIALDGTAHAAEPLAGTALYRFDGTPAGWIGLEAARPASLEPITIDSEFRELVLKSTARFADDGQVKDPGSPSADAARPHEFRRSASGSRGSSSRKSAKYYTPAPSSSSGYSTGSSQSGTSQGPRTYGR